MKIKRICSRGSFTVEAAVVVPLAVFLIAALVGLTFFAHDRVWFTGAACEAALAANAAEDGESAAQQKIGQRTADRILPGTAPEAFAEIRRHSAAVRFTGARELLYFGKLSAWQAAAEVRRVRPAGDLRTWWAMKRFGKEILEWDI